MQVTLVMAGVSGLPACYAPGNQWVNEESMMPVGDLSVSGQHVEFIWVLWYCQLGPRKYIQHVNSRDVIPKQMEGEDQRAIWVHVHNGCEKKVSRNVTTRLVVWLSGRTSVFSRRTVLSLSCARPVADGWPLMWVNRPLCVNQPGQLSLSSLRVDRWVVSCN